MLGFRFGVCEVLEMRRGAARTPRTYGPDMGVCVNHGVCLGMIFATGPRT